MIVLLDTHTFIWFDAEPAKLSLRAAALLADPNNRVLLSAASVWELVIKVAIGKLTLRDEVKNLVESQVTQNAVELLDIRADHVLAVGGLPDVHKDPFDRILAAQALVEGAVLLTNDPVFKQYPIQSDW
jgi:PIN domain nuclease of toxin-antitoxin system